MRSFFFAAIFGVLEGQNLLAQNDLFAHGCLSLQPVQWIVKQLFLGFEGSRLCYQPLVEPSNVFLVHFSHQLLVAAGHGLLERFLCLRRLHAPIVWDAVRSRGQLR